MLFPTFVMLHAVLVAQMQDSTLCLIEPHTIDRSPLIQPVQIPLQSLPVLQQINSYNAAACIVEMENRDNHVIPITILQIHIR